MSFLFVLQSTFNKQVIKLQVHPTMWNIIGESLKRKPKLFTPTSQRFLIHFLLSAGQIKKLKKGRPVAYSFSGLMATKKDRGKHVKHRSRQTSGQTRQKGNPTSGKEWTPGPRRHQDADKKSRHNKQKRDFKNKSRQFRGPKASDKQTKHKQKERAWSTWVQVIFLSHNCCCNVLNFLVYMN